MPRIYVSQKITQDTLSVSDADQLHHLRDVLRLKTGDRITVFDSEGCEYTAAIAGWEKKQVLLSIQACRPPQPERYRISVACAVPKKSRLDDVVDKLTQLGVSAIIPLNTERVVARLTEKEDARLERWRRIARSAAEQSRRTTLPAIHRLYSFPEVLSLAPEFDLKLLPTLTAESLPLNRVALPPPPARILALIGPEGDFTPSEVRQALDSGFTPISLGDTVLRVETAAVAVAAYLKIASLD